MKVNSCKYEKTGYVCPSINLEKDTIFIIKGNILQIFVFDFLLMKCKYLLPQQSQLVQLIAQQSKAGKQNLQYFYINLFSLFKPLCEKIFLCEYPMKYVVTKWILRFTFNVTIKLCSTTEWNILLYVGDQSSFQVSGPLLLIACKVNGAGE